MWMPLGVVAPPRGAAGAGGRVGPAARKNPGAGGQRGGGGCATPGGGLHRSCEEDSAMGSPPTPLIRDLTRFGRKVARQFAIEKMILFGSRARERPRPDSDVDLIRIGRRFRHNNPIDR